MQLGRLQDDRLGLVTDRGFVDLSEAFTADPRRPYVDPMVQLIERWEELRPKIADLAANGAAIQVDPAELGPPVRRPRKIVNLCTEIDSLEPGQKAPIDWFFKSPESVAGPTGAITLPPHYATGFQLEAEVAVVIGRSAHNVSADEASSVIFGYTAVLDGMGAGLGRGMGTYFNKSFDTFCPMGPTLLVSEPGLDASQLEVQLSINGAIATRYAVGDLPHSVAELIADVTTYFRLLPGDIVACGAPTNESFQIAHRDSVSVEVSRIGAMNLTVDDPLCRHRERVA